MLDFIEIAGQTNKHVHPFCYIHYILVFFFYIQLLVYIWYFVIICYCYSITATYLPSLLFRILI